MNTRKHTHTPRIHVCTCKYTSHTCMKAYILHLWINAFGHTWTVSDAPCKNICIQQVRWSWDICSGFLGVILDAPISMISKWVFLHVNSRFKCSIDVSAASCTWAWCAWAWGIYSYACICHDLSMNTHICDRYRYVIHRLTCVDVCDT